MQQTLIIGFAGNDADLRYTPANKAVCSFSVACTERWGSGDNRREKTTWYECVGWEEKAQTLAKYVKKGTRIMVIGKVEAKAFKNNQGEAQAKLELTIEKFEFLGGTSDGESAPRQQQALAPNNSYDDFDEFSSPIGHDDPF